MPSSRTFVRSFHWEAPMLIVPLVACAVERSVRAPAEAMEPCMVPARKTWPTTKFESVARVWEPDRYSVVSRLAVPSPLSVKPERTFGTPLELIEYVPPAEVTSA